ncbi:hypothetical protein Sps_03458 [Shewanella psychrophila]|uniref:Uncharacterized protein n=1 Tax=Shewanella psychrophila TaxID=225848 RepID=A0A1S6HST8_9GAMM|nr:hypothetical protein [Shewanella psychrophila]AQS38585.1 hypothetical protein Sps_03458 [Shewanella psychrophila]
MTDRNKGGSGGSNKGGSGGLIKGGDKGRSQGDERKKIIRPDDNVHVNKDTTSTGPRSPRNEKK